MAKSLIFSLTIALLIGLPQAQAEAETIAAERQKLATHEQRIKELQGVNADIQANVGELDNQIGAAINEVAPEAKTRDNAEQRYQKAQAVVEADPSPSNQQLAETAKFEFFMADRKYQRASRDLKALEHERADLQRALASNNRQISNTSNMVSHQRKLVAQMEDQARTAATQQASNERVLRTAKESELEQSRAEHAAAVAEIDRLKAMLAEKEAAAAEQLAQDAAAAEAAQNVADADIAQSAAAEAFATVAAAETVARLEQTGGASSAMKSELKAGSKNTQLASADIKQGDAQLWNASNQDDAVEQYKRLMSLANADNGKRKLNKILHIKTYRHSRLIKQTSHTLKYLGNDQYKGKTRVRAGDTKFVIGGNRWSQEIQKQENNRSYVFVLDLRSKEKPELLVLHEAAIK